MKSLLNNNKRPSKLVEGIDVDVTPVMNMFIILIPFLVSMAVFTHLSVLEFSLPSNSGLGQGPKDKDLKLTIAMLDDSFLITLGENVLDSIPQVEGAYDFIKLHETLEKERVNLKIKNEIIIAINDKIKFNKVVATMDECKSAGFIKLSLAGGNE